MRQELIDFAQFLLDNVFIYKFFEPDKTVDFYLKSINDNAPTESRSINENEAKRKECDHEFNNVFVNGHPVCCKCKKIVYG